MSILKRIRNLFTGETEKQVSALEKANRTMANDLLEANKRAETYRKDLSRIEYQRLKSGYVWLKPGEIVVSANVFQEFCDNHQISHRDAKREIDMRERRKNPPEPKNRTVPVDPDSPITDDSKFRIDRLD